MKNKNFYFAITFFLFCVFVLPAFLVGCTDNQRAKKYGGTQKIELESGQRLVNVTWKEGSNLWILTKEDNTIKPTVYTFKEKSNLGIVEGTILIYEK